MTITGVKGQKKSRVLLVTFAAVSNIHAAALSPRFRRENYSEEDYSVDKINSVI